MAGWLKLAILRLSAGWRKGLASTHIEVAIERRVDVGVRAPSSVLAFPLGTRQTRERAVGVVDQTYYTSGTLEFVAERPTALREQLEQAADVGDCFEVANQLNRRLDLALVEAPGGVREAAAQLGGALVEGDRVLRGALGMLHRVV